MKVSVLSAILFAVGAMASAQGSSQAHHSSLGFSYSIPTDWQIVNENPSLPVLKEQQSQSAGSEEERKGIQCVQLELTARQGTPPSVISVLQLPFGCFGQRLTDAELPGFAEGASEQLKQSFDLAPPQYGSYNLGTHTLWIERAKGSVIGHPEAQYTIEIACSVLKLGAVCWMAAAADETALQTFEHGKVSLDGEAPVPLVPSTAFDRKPGS